MRCNRIIDCGFAKSLPLQFAVSFPRFLAIKPPQTDVTQSADIVAFSLASLQPSPVLQTDRQCVMSYLSSKMTSLIQSISVVLSAPNVNWRFLIFEATCSNGLHEWMVKVLWLLPGTRGEWNDLSNVLLTEEVDRLLAGMIDQRSWLSREMLVDAIKSNAKPPKSELRLISTAQPKSIQPQ